MLLNAKAETLELIAHVVKCIYNMKLQCLYWKIRETIL